ncbi:Myo-inositol 2-dehydrogenase [hydrothermal vent metagenome]|uniref:Myo-inositol 2-dehydrogenase n=1 Tax=hydrothermal vent metagenome TaxID=652676 RepID=A0A3B0TYA3_9ZZZZ
MSSKKNLIIYLICNLMEVEKKVNRRKFIKNSTTLTIGGVLLSTLPGQLYANVSGKEVLKVGLVGCGGRGSGAIFQVLKASPSVRVVAIGDTFKDRVDKLHERIEIKYKDQSDITEATKFVGFDAYKKVIEICDVVLLATPPPFRPTHFEASIKANKHTFMEKPLAVDVPGYKKIIEIGKLAEKKNLNVVVGLQNRYSTPVLEMVKRINNGEIGKITSINTYYNVTAPTIIPREPQQTEMEYQIRNWRYFTWLWGGQLAGQAIHQIDAMNMLMNDYPISALGNGGRLVFNGVNQGNTYDHFFIEYEYKNGIQMHSQCRNMVNTTNRSGWEVRGSKGIANERFQFKDYNGNTFWNYRNNDEVGAYQKEQNVFINSILKGTRINNTEYAAKSTLTAIMGRMTAETGKKITMDKLLSSKVNIVPEDISWNSKSVLFPDKYGNYKIIKPGIKLLK